MAGLAKRVGLGLAVVVTVAMGYVGYQLSTSPAMFLQSCAETPTFPGSRWACRQALYTFHPTADEVQQMNETAGVDWALSMTDDAEARRLLQHYIKAGVDVNAVDKRHPEMNWTALHVAAAGADLRAVRLLLDAGAKAEVQDGKGRTPLDLVREGALKFANDPKYAEVEKVLLGAGSQPHSATSSVGSALAASR